MRDSRRKKLKLYCLTLALMAVTVIVLAGISELLLRWLYVSQAVEKLDHVEETDYTPIRFKGEYRGTLWGIPFKTNRFGFRDEEEFSTDPPAEEYRILSLGDSIGFGLGIPSEDHYTQVLERRLNQSSDKRIFRVINAGGQGYSPSGYFAYLRNEGLRLKPDLVLIEIELCNDTTDEALLNWGELDDDGYLKIIQGGRYVVSWDGKQLGTYATKGYFFEKTYLYTDLARRILNLAQKISPREPWSTRPGARVYYSLGFDRFLLDNRRLEKGDRQLFAALSGTVELLKSNGIDCMIMIMPSRYLYQEAYDYTLFASSIYREALASAENLDLPFLDMYGTIEKNGGESLFIDFAHLTSEGNQAVGLELYNHFSELASEQPKRAGAPQE